MTIYTGKRGQAFEYTLDYTNKLYENQGRALINKRPTPMKIIGKTRGKQHICVFDKKSTVDYDGIYAGCAITFEAKTTEKKSFPLSMLTEHQVKYLNEAEKQRAISFVIVEMRALRDVFLVPNNMVQKYIRKAEHGGRKSIPMDDLEIYAFMVESKNGVPLDYLSAVDRLIAAETA
ncbi:Holliday junction resolvase RecU [Virgibacillus sp. YIM 98842]|uniref:Holliday junction resolvase RecU n=1 Tax=Virgibacillus sp. YIM 98842 TaxID=2663533 RepID=UPI0013DABB2D|nr:Holliday junction resolvase RecU [Virgibacillus sp. YIM 98842]